MSANTGGSGRGNARLIADADVGILQLEITLQTQRRGEMLSGSGHNLRGRKSVLGLLGHLAHPPADPEPTCVPPASQSVPVQPRPTNDHSPLPTSLLGVFLDEQDTSAPGLIHEAIADVLFGVPTGGNVSARSTRFCE